MAPRVIVGPCGHIHRVMANQEAHRARDHALWRVVESVTADPTREDPIRGAIALEPGTKLRHDQSAWDLQGCAGFETVFSMERFQVLDGPHGGRCLEVLVIDANPGELALPPRFQPA
jgi:hypothetical protein